MDGNNRDLRDRGLLSEEQAGAASIITIEQLRHLVRLLDRSDVSELEFKRAEEGTHLVLRKVQAPAVGSPSAGALSGGQVTLSNLSPPGDGSPVEDDLSRPWSGTVGGSAELAEDMSNLSHSPAETKHTVIAPLVGIFHARAKPKGKPLVTIGDHVKVGQHVAAIESLNVLNEVESPAAGRISEILVQEGQPVEYGQPLMTIDSTEET